MTKEEFNQLLTNSKNDSIIFVSQNSLDKKYHYILCAIPFFCIKDKGDIIINTSAQIILDCLHKEYDLRTLEITIKHKKNSHYSKKEEGEALAAYLLQIK